MELFNMKVLFNRTILVFVTALSINYVSLGQTLDEFKFTGESKILEEDFIKNSFQFNGYTNYWHDTYSQWYRYGNLYKIAIPDVEKNILQSKVDVAEDMGFPGLIMQEGFVSGLLSEPFNELENPNRDEISSSATSSNLLIFTDPETEVGKLVISTLPEGFKFPEKLNSHQYGDVNLQQINAFVLRNENRKLFVISSTDKNLRDKLKHLIDNTKDIISKYKMYKGWFGAETLLKSVTCTDGHPLDVIGRGMNEGNSWFVFSGYMDFLAKTELENWMNEVNLPVVTDVGFGSIYGCKDYDGLQVQSMFAKDSWNEYAKEKGGYVFRQVWDTLADPFRYDGYMATEGNKEHIDNEDVPFVLRTGSLDGNALSSMVLFIQKDLPLTRETMWSAIMDRREVGILEMGKMMGPANYRNTLQLLLLDKVYLEEYFGDRLNLETKVEGYDLHVTFTNLHPIAVSGKLEFSLPKGLKIKENIPSTINLPSGTAKTLHFTLQPSKEAMAYANPIAVNYTWDGKAKSTIAMLDLPPTISVHQLLYAHAPEVDYPVTIHNFTDKSSFPVKVQVVGADNQSNVVYTTSQKCETSTGTFKDLLFKLEVPSGNYNVKVTTLGIDYVSQLGVGKAEGKPYAYAIDLDNDGVNEYRLENDSVQITLLATGARVIEYIVKSRDDNVLFKLWPKKAIDDKRPFRKRGYYPYGGFEDFLGQGSMETHQIYNAEILHKEGDFVRVKMWTDYYGNRLEKTFTLYGNSPLLEVRFALTFKNPEANVLGPQPILELGKKHWTEDVFTIPELDGLHEYRMTPEKYYGRLFFLKEGWNAGYDTKEDITFVGAFPVDQPLFLHMWMNHPRNGDAHHYYTEFQPWTPIYQKSTMYFSYYIWGAGGPWEHGVNELRQRNLITKTSK